jgi:uncharacterized membrane protein
MPSDVPDDALPGPAARQSGPDPVAAADGLATAASGQALPARPALQRLRALSVACAVALAVLCLAWELWLAPTGQRTLAVKALPALLALPGMLRHRLYTYRWLSLALWLYVLEGLLRATTEAGASRLLAIGEVGLALMLFSAAAMYIRLRLRAAQPAPAA